MQVNPVHMTPARIQEEPKGCCSKKAQDNAQWVQILSQVCRVALAVFAYIVSPLLFTVSFAAGVVSALAYIACTKGGDQNLGTLRPICGQGYMEFLSGKAFPLWTVYVVTTAFIAAHVRHDPVFFVPFCGLFIGWWAGSTGYSFAHRMVSLPPEPVRSCCRL